MTWRYFKRRIKQVLFEGDNRLHVSNIRYLPRWLVMCIDICFVVFSAYASYLLIRSLPFSFYSVISLYGQLGILLGTQILLFLVFRTYAGLIRHSTFVDLLKIALAVASASIILLFVNYACFYILGFKVFNVPSLVIYTVLAFATLWSYRQLVKFLYSHYSSSVHKDKYKRVLILGVSDDSIAVAEAMSLSYGNEFLICGYISNQAKKARMTIGGKPIYGFTEELTLLKQKKGVTGVLIVGTLSQLSDHQREIDQLLELGFKIYHSPTVQEWDKEESLAQNIKSIQIEDLLDREKIEMSDHYISGYLKGKIVLVTGGAGSIGSEISRQVLDYHPKQLIVLDSAESPLHELRLELSSKFPDAPIHYILGSVRNRPRMESIFKAQDIDVVFHAAAYKHVPLVEENPEEGFLTNIMGTKVAVDLAVQNKVTKFVMVSTDKAVNPTSVMGATKRAAELYVQHKQQEEGCTTSFITTRFGNVLGSNGSVIPRFKDQIKNGGPVTVTHPEIIRYFMTIEEACQLVLQAGIMGNGGEIFVFDMGEPVKIVDLARKMIRLSGFEPNKDIEITFTGLRPGEKLFEELLNDKNHVIPTHHEKIMKAVNKNANEHNILDVISLLETSDSPWKNKEMVLALKKAIPEYKSQNSEFSTLDS